MAGKTKKPSYKIPLLPDGSVEHYHNGYSTEVVTGYPVGPNGERDWHNPITVPYNFVDPFEFTAELEFVELNANYRAGAHAKVKDVVTGATYPVFLREFEEMIPLMVNGRVTAKFGFRKQGSNFSLVLV